MTTALSAHPRIFSDRYLDKKMGHFSLLNLPEFEKKLGLIKEWQAGIASQRILKAKEEQLQDDFLKLFFGEVLDYSYRQDLSTWQLEREYKTVLDGTKADGALGYFSLEKGKLTGLCRAVIELKDARSDLDKPQSRQNDRRTPVQQAFDYASAVGGDCRWVIVSNFLEIRLYHQSDRSRYERFEISQLNDEATLKRFFFLLQQSRLLSQNESPLDQLYRERQIEEASISAAFYREYKQARIDLFEHLRAENPSTDPLLILAKTQKILDRVTFVWFCEDFQIVPALTLRRLLEAVKQDSFNPSETKIWDRVRGLFKAINDGHPAAGINKFNGGLFAPDPELEALKIHDSVLEHIIALEKYDFASDLNVNILGHIFEQSISDLEAIKAGVGEQSYDPKQGKRKKDGIFYTPEYITRYLVEQAVGGWLEARRQELGQADLPELSPEDYESIQVGKGGLKANKKIQKHLAFWEGYRLVLARIRVLDPACGSGAFLNQVFDYLYHEGQKVNDTLAQLKLGQRELFDLDRQILSQNLFGVDLNPESVEITRLSLWLKTANSHKELTSLDGNIRVGNSLIADPAFAAERAFDWAAAFPEIINSGGFDVVVGNPPYVRQELFSDLKPYLEQHYAVYHGVADLYVYFFEKGLNLLKPGGRFGFICSNKFMKGNYGEPLRRYLTEEVEIKELVDFGELPVFQEAATFPALYVFSKNKVQIQAPFYAAIKHLKFDSLTDEIQACGYVLDHASIRDSQNWQLSNPQEIQLLEKMKSGGIQLGDYVENKFYRGVLTGFNEAFVIEQTQRDQLIQQDPRSAEILKPFLVGDDVRRYHLNYKGKYLILFPKGWTNTHREDQEPWMYMQKRYPAICQHLAPYQVACQKRTDKGDYWWELRACDYYSAFEKTKIIYPDIAKESRFFFDTQSHFFGNTAYMILTENQYLMAVLNSKAFWFNLKYICSVLGDPNEGGRLRLFTKFVEKIPIPTATPEQEAELAALAEQNQALHQKMSETRSKALAFLARELGVGKISQKLEKFETLSWSEFTAELGKQKIKLSLNQKEEWQDWHAGKVPVLADLRGQIAALDAAIDRLVYGLYGLSASEIALVEGQA